jgi:hypothetical protein
VSLRSRRLALALAVALAVVAAAVVWFFARSPAVERLPSVHPLAIVPPGPALVVSVDLARLRAARSGQALLGRSLAEIAGGRCESALASDTDELALAMPGDTAQDHASPDALALIGAGRFLGSVVATCAEEHIRARHGDPVRTTIGTFVSVRDRRQAGEIAARDGLLIVSEGLYLRSLIDAADGPRVDGTPAERERDQLHAELRRVVGRGAPIIATLVLPAGWLGHALADPTADLSPLATIRSAALRADVTDALDVTAVVTCDSSEACVRLEHFLGAARTDMAAEWPDAAALLARVTLARTETRLDLTAHWTPEDVRRLTATPAPRASAP